MSIIVAQKCQICQHNHQEYCLLHETDIAEHYCCQSFLKINTITFLKAKIKEVEIQGERVFDTN